MDDSKTLQVILDKLEKLDSKVDKLDNKVTTLQSDVVDLKEDSAITRNGVNTLLDWAEKAQIEVKIPLYKKAE